MDDILSKALREFMSGPLHKLLLNLGGQDGGEWEREFGRFLRKEPCWNNVVVLQKKTFSLLLQLVTKITVPAIQGKFVAREKFVINTEIDGLTNIRYIDYNFRTWFMDKVEEDVPDQTLYCFKLIHSAQNSLVAEEIGGEDKLETNLSVVSHLLSKQKSGESGVLLKNGHTNVFYVRDASGELRSVFVSWLGLYWLVSAYSIGYTYSWKPGSYVFSRDAMIDSFITKAS